MVLKSANKTGSASIIKQIIKILWIFIKGQLNDSNNYEEMSQYRYIFHKNLYASSEILCFKIMNLLASFALGGFNPWAAGFGIGSLVLFGLVGLVAGPNLKNFDPDA